MKKCLLFLFKPRTNTCSVSLVSWNAGASETFQRERDMSSKIPKRRENQVREEARVRCENIPPFLSGQVMVEDQVLM